MEESGLDNLGMSKTTINHKLRVISDAEYHMYVNSAYVANWWTQATAPDQVSLPGYAAHDAAVGAGGCREATCRQHRTQTA